jgi:hypothetical protein
MSISYFFTGAFAGAFLAGSGLAGALSTGLSATGALTTGATFAAAGAAVFALVSAGDAVFALASAVFAFVFVVLKASVPSGLLERTETLPLNAGIARNRADSMNVVAATIVTFDRTVAVPRGLNAELETLLVNNAPASVLPGCSNTAATSTMHETKNIPYNK